MAGMSPIQHLFPSPSFLRVLELLALHADRSFYQREIARETGCALLTCQRALQRLESAGLVAGRRDGNRVYFRIVSDHPVYPELRSLLWKTVALGDRIRSRLDTLGGGDELVFLFGSIAAGTETADSDIDLMIVGEMDETRLASPLAAIGRDLSREFNPVVFPRSEFRRKVRSGNRFLNGVVSSPKIWLRGTEDELATLVGDGVHPPGGLPPQR